MVATTWLDMPFDEFDEWLGPALAPRAYPERITLTERHMLAVWAVDPVTNKQLALKLGVGVRAVNGCMDSCIHKLHAQNRAGLMKIIHEAWLRYYRN